MGTRYSDSTDCISTPLLSTTSHRYIHLAISMSQILQWSVVLKPRMSKFWLALYKQKPVATMQRRLCCASLLPEGGFVVWEMLVSPADVGPVLPGADVHRMSWWALTHTATLQVHNCKVSCIFLMVAISGHKCPRQLRSHNKERKFRRISSVDSQICILVRHRMFCNKRVFNHHILGYLPHCKWRARQGVKTSASSTSSIS